MNVSKKYIEEIIEKGGEIKNDELNEYSLKYKVITQKIRMDVLQEIKKALLKRPGMNRNIWIQEAIQEKINRLKEDGI